MLFCLFDYTIYHEKIIPIINVLNVKLIIKVINRNNSLSLFMF